MPDNRTHNATAVPGPGAHIPALDGLRGLAILAVMVFHQTVMAPATALDRALIRQVPLLSSGVDLFFVLSGFLITGILYDSKASSRYFRNFYARRFLRIFPLYYAVLFAALVVLPHFPHPKLEKWGHVQGFGALWYWLFLSNWSIALGGVGMKHGLIDLSWTLSIEEQFYLLWPIVVLWLRREALARICVVLIVGALALRLAMVVTGSPVMWITMMTPARMDALAVGAWIALTARGPRGVAGLIPGARRTLALSAMILAGVYLPATPLALPNRVAVAAGTGSLPLGNVFRYGVGLSAMAVLYGSLLVLAVGGRPGGRLGRVLSHPFLTTFGAYSYALYLFHNPIQAAVRDLVYRPDRFPTLLGSPIPGQLLFYVAASIPALALAWLSWNLYEKPLLSLKKFFPSGRRAAVTSASRGATLGEGALAPERAGRAPENDIGGPIGPAPNDEDESEGAAAQGAIRER